MKRVVHIGYVHTYNDTRILMKECISLKKTGKYDVTYITSNKNADFLDKEFNGISVEIINLNKEKGKLIFEYLKQVKVRLEEINADIYHIHEPLLLPLVFWLKKRNKRVIYDMHEDSAGDMADYFKKYGKLSSLLVKRIVSWYEKKAIKKTDGFIYVTPQFEKQGLDIDNRALIPNFPIIDEKINIPVYEDYVKRKESICFAGGIGDIWSHKLILESIGKIKNIEYNLAGRSTETYLNELKELDGWKKTNYYGVVSFNEVKEIYNKSRIGMSLLSHVFDGDEMGTLGNTKIYEFMSVGLPIICTNFKLWQNMIEKYNCGIVVDLQDADELIETIEYLIYNPKEAYKMGCNGIKAIREEYNWTNLELELFKIYEIALN